MEIRYLAADEDALAENRAANVQMAAAMAAGPRIENIPPAKVRESRANGTGPFPQPALDPRAETRTIAGPAGDITLRIIRPAAPDGVFLHIHGGGFTFGHPTEYEELLVLIADAMNLVAVSVDYRLAPEHPFPAGPDDCEAAALWVVANAAAEFGTDRLFIGGESAGANLCVVTMLRLRDRHGLTPFLGANLAYGWYDLGLTPSCRNWGTEALVLSTPLCEFLAQGYLPGRSREERRAPDASPLHADLHGMPPTMFTVGTSDALVDDSMFLAMRWQQAGNETVLQIVPDGMHGFDSLPTALSRLGNESYVEFVRHIMSRG